MRAKFRPALIVLMSLALVRCTSDTNSDVCLAGSGGQPSDGGGDETGTTGGMEEPDQPRALGSEKWEEIPRDEVGDGHDWIYFAANGTIFRIPSTDGAPNAAGGTQLPSDEFRSIFGSDDRFPIVSESTLQSFPHRAVGLLSVTVPGANPGKGSGVMVGPRHVLTAAHVVTTFVGGDPVFFDQNSSLPMTVTFAPGHKNLVDLNGPPRNVEGALYHEDWLANPNNANFDVAVLLLEDLEETASLGWWAMCPASNQWHNSASYDVVGYPALIQQCANTPRPDDPNPGTKRCWQFMYEQHGCKFQQDHFLGITPTIIPTDCDAQPGQSGSPMYIDCGDRPCVVGVLATSDPDTTLMRRMSTGMVDDFTDWICENGSQFGDGPC